MQRVRAPFAFSHSLNLGDWGGRWCCRSFPPGSCAPLLIPAFPCFSVSFSPLRLGSLASPLSPQLQGRHLQGPRCGHRHPGPPPGFDGKGANTFRGARQQVAGRQAPPRIVQHQQFPRVSACSEVNGELSCTQGGGPIGRGPPPSSWVGRRGGGIRWGPLPPFPSIPGVAHGGILLRAIGLPPFPLSRLINAWVEGRQNSQPSPSLSPTIVPYGILDSLRNSSIPVVSPPREIARCMRSDQGVQTDRSFHLNFNANSLLGRFVFL